MTPAEATATRTYRLAMALVREPGVTVTELATLLNMAHKAAMRIAKLRGVVVSRARA